MLALRDGVVPMLHSTAFAAENRIRVVSYIPCSKYIRIRGFEIFVDDDAVVHWQAGLLGQAYHRPHSNAGNQQLKIDGLPV